MQFSLGRSAITYAELRQAASFGKRAMIPAAELERFVNALGTYEIRNIGRRAHKPKTQAIETPATESASPEPEPASTEPGQSELQATIEPTTPKQPDRFTIHPLAEKFPTMSEKDFEELKESIRNYGLATVFNLSTTRISTDGI